MEASRFNCNPSVTIAGASNTSAGATYLLFLANMLRCAWDRNAEKRKSRVSRVFMKF
jgi:N-acyl-L-homoserine lactone synthetase